MNACYNLVCMYICVCMYVYVCMCVCVYEYVLSILHIVIFSVCFPHLLVCFYRKFYSCTTCDLWYNRYTSPNQRSPPGTFKSYFYISAPITWTSKPWTVDMYLSIHHMYKCVHVYVCVCMCACLGVTVCMTNIANCTHCVCACILLCVCTCVCACVRVCVLWYKNNVINVS